MYSGGIEAENEEVDRSGSWQIHPLLRHIALEPLEPFQPSEPAAARMASVSDPHTHSSISIDQHHAQSIQRHLMQQEELTFPIQVIPNLNASITSAQPSTAHTFLWNRIPPNSVFSMVATDPSFMNGHVDGLPGSSSQSHIAFPLQLPQHSPQSQLIMQQPDTISPQAYIAPLLPDAPKPSSKEQTHASHIDSTATSVATSTPSSRTSIPADKILTCPEPDCGYTTHRKSNMRQHLPTHNPQHERPFVCDECDKAFRRRKDLERHSSVHISQPQFECDVCGRAYKRRDGMLRHKKSHER